MTPQPTPLVYVSQTIGTAVAADVDVIVVGAVAPCEDPNVAAKNSGDGNVGFVVNSGVYHAAVIATDEATVGIVVAVSPNATYTNPFGATVETFVITRGVPNVKL
jgi:hypothetical protein